MLIDLNPYALNPRTITRLAGYLAQGNVLAFPTDTLYAVGCDILCRDAVERLHEIKEDEGRKPLSLLCSGMPMVGRYAQLDDLAFRVVRNIWPGPYTVILKPSSEIPRWVLGKRKTIGMRVPENVLLQGLIAELDRPILATSINREILADNGNPVAINECPKLRKYIEYVVDLGIETLEGDAVGSSVIDLTGPEPVVIREGLGPLDFLA